MRASAAQDATSLRLAVLARTAFPAVMLPFAMRTPTAMHTASPHLAMRTWTAPMAVLPQFSMRTRLAFLAALLHLTMRAASTNAAISQFAVLTSSPFLALASFGHGSTHQVGVPFPAHGNW